MEHSPHISNPPPPIAFCSCWPTPRVWNIDLLNAPPPPGGRPELAQRLLPHHFKSTTLIMGIWAGSEAAGWLPANWLDHTSPGGQGRCCFKQIYGFKGSLALTFLRVPPHAAFPPWALWSVFLGLLPYELLCVPRLFSKKNLRNQSLLRCWECSRFWPSWVRSLGMSDTAARPQPPLCKWIPWDHVNFQITKIQIQTDNDYVFFFHSMHCNTKPSTVHQRRPPDDPRNFLSSVNNQLRLRRDVAEDVETSKSHDQSPS